MLNSNQKKNFFWNMFGSILSCSSSFFFLLTVLRTNDLNQAGIFAFAFSFATFLQTIAVYAGRTYQVTEPDNQITSMDYIFHRFFSCVLMFLIGISFLPFFTSEPLKCTMIFLLLLYRSLEAFSDVFHGILQKNNELYKVGISLSIRGLFSLLFFVTIDFFTHNVLVAIGSLVLINLVTLIFFDMRNTRKYLFKKDKFHFRNVITLFQLGFFTFFFTFLTQYILNAQKYTIEQLQANQEQAIFNILVMPATIMILVSQFSIHPFLVELSEYWHSNQLKNFKKLVFRLISYLSIIGCLLTLIAYFCGIPFLEWIYGIDLTIYLFGLIAILIGSTIFSITNIFCTALVTMRKTWIQVIIYGIACVLTYIYSIFFVQRFSIMGACISYLITMTLLFLLYLLTYMLEINKRKGSIYYV